MAQRSCMQTLMYTYISFNYPMSYTSDTSVDLNWLKWITSKIM